MLKFKIFNLNKFELIILTLKFQHFQKETSEAVNSIMELATEVIDEPESIRKIDFDDVSQSEYAAAKIQDLENIKGKQLNFN